MRGEGVERLTHVEAARQVAAVKAAAIEVPVKENERPLAAAGLDFDQGALDRLRVGLLREQARQLLHRGSLEEDRRVHASATRPLDFHHHPSREQGVAPIVEEIVRDAERADIKQLLPDVGEVVLKRIPLLRSDDRWS